MIIVRTPMRIALGGGGTDLPSYYQQHGGFVLSAAINKYIYIGINRTFTDDYLLKYSQLERVKTVDEIQHRLIREVLRRHPVGPALEVVSLADIPSGTGLGSSGSFTVGLLRAVYAFKREHVTAGALAEEACHIEIDLLQSGVGKQDQYVAAYGGIITMEFAPDGAVRVSPLSLSNATLHDLEERLLMFFTGYSRDASTILAHQNQQSRQKDAAMLENLHFTKQLGLRIREALEQGDVRAFAAMMHEHWEWKRRRSPEVSNPRIDRWYEVGVKNGALGGKLVGAGGGGFLLFYADNPQALRLAMAAEGLTEVRFFFDHDGSVVSVRDQ
jgi:D-glycero-alpha-D-manno-heptose-7-phosphate kinase